METREEILEEHKSLLTAVNEILAYRLYPKESMVSDDDALTTLTEIIGWATELRNQISSITGDEQE